MEVRKITVYSTKNQEKKTILSNAVTLGELKRDLISAGIDYTDMSFFEGISRTELRDDNSILPHDLVYKGQRTNELVFMLTNTNKKIKSGLGNERKDLYRIIKKYGLEDECRKRFNCCYTQCKNSELLSFIQEVEHSDKFLLKHSGKQEYSCKQDEIKKRLYHIIKGCFDVCQFLDYVPIESLTRINSDIKTALNISEDDTNEEDMNEDDIDIDEMFNFI